MNKRITSILFCFIIVIVFSMPVFAVPAYAMSTEEPIDVTIEPDKTEATPGDTITYTVYVGPVKRLQSINFTLLIPAGLTYIDGVAVTGLKDLLGAEKAEYTNSTKTFVAYGGGSYNSDGKTAIMTFSCIVDSGTVGQTLKITFDGDEDFADDEWETYYTNYNFDSSKVTIAAKPIAVTGVTIDETLAVKTGESKTPRYAVNPAEATNKTVSFESNNTAVATVNETTGEVTGVKEGTATITITTADGNFTGTCVVTVACSHASKTPVEEKPSDCKDKGWDAYIKCDDCGRLFKADGITEIAEIPFRELSGEHTGGDATCTTQAVCTVCGQPYGDFAAHSYTDTDMKAEALMTAGNCSDYAVYYYSCSACGKIEHNDSHTFNGDKVPGAHVGETTLVNMSEANHRTQTDGYTGDTKCLGCGEIIAYGQAIPAGEHTPSDVWSTDGQYHRKECSVVGCGVAIDGSEAEHTSTGANVATCQKEAVCDICNASYGTVADHDWNSAAWEKDATGHWHKCTKEGCGVVIDNSKAAHTPDRDAATEADPIKCSVCGYEISPALGHTHAPGTDWKSDENNHWNECACGDKANTAAHTDANRDGKCDVCEYNVGNPQTDDSNLTPLWIILFCIIGLGVVAAIVLVKKKFVK